MLNEEVMLTTLDNPFNPFTQFRKWFLYDIEKGYNTCQRLGRFTYISDELSSVENNDETIRAMKDFLKYDYTNNYIVVNEKGKKIPLEAL